MLNMIKYWGQNNPCSTKNIINTVGMFRTAFCTHWAQKHRPVGSSQRVLGTRTITLYVCLHSWQWSQPARKHRIDKPLCFSTLNVRSDVFRFVILIKHISPNRLFLLAFTVMFHARVSWNSWPFCFSFTTKLLWPWDNSAVIFKV